MKKTGLIFACIGVIAAFLCACAQTKPFVRPNPDLIGGHTAGIISRTSPIKVVFSKPVGSAGSMPAGSLLTFSPPISGKAEWVDEYNLTFEPASALKPGQVYTATIEYDAVKGAIVDDDYCNFMFAVKKPGYSISFEGLDIRSGDRADFYDIAGTIVTDDLEDLGKIEKLISFKPRAEHITLTWEHGASPSLEHRFMIAGIPRKKSAYPFTVSWTGNRIKSKIAGSRRFEIPANGAFEVLDMIPATGEEEHVLVTFSEPLDKRQDFRGLVRLEGVDELRFSSSGNRLKVYSPGTRFAQSVSVRVERGIRSASGVELAVPAANTVMIEYQKPEVRFPGAGVILPASQGLTVPIETMNLNAVMVEAIKIHGDNMTQFLQVNQLDSDRELYRVGNVVWQKVVPLGWSANQANTWIRHGLDLTPLVKNFPDGMFQLQVTFRKPHVQFSCSGQLTDSETERANELEFPGIEGKPGGEPDEQSSWDYYESYNEDYYRSYDRRFDPCHPAYYAKYGDHNVTVRKNVLASNIGLIAKLDTNNALHVFSSDLRNALPLANVSVKVLNYARLAIGNGITDKNGFATVKCSDTPFFVVAEHAKQSGYLKLDEGSALAMSHFDTGGTAYTAGVKGLIYGERSVWRPGDDIYLTFVLFDPDKKIPPRHPLQVELTNPRGQVAYKGTRTDSLNGFYQVRLSTQSDAPTGDWQFRARLGGATFTKTLKIENVMPNRLKLDLRLDGKDYITEGDVRGTLAAQWLHGAKASNLQADIAVSFFSVPTSFPRFAGYVFDDPTRESVPGRQELFAGNLDGDGVCRFAQSLYLSESVSGKLRANFAARVFESSGVFSSEQFALDCYPYSRFVGMKLPKGDEARGMLLTDTKHKTEIVMVDAEGRPVSSGEVTAEIFKIRWRWWWEKQPESLADYASSTSVTMIQSGRVKIANGKGEWEFMVKYPDWGRYFVRVRDAAGKHAAGKIVYIDWPGWAGRGQKENPGGANMLTINTEKPAYAVGDKVRVTFPSNKEGRALVCIESGGKLIKKEWIVPAAQTTTYDFIATPAMTPNIYVHVTFLQPHLQTANDLPIRVYGVVPVSVEDPTTRIAPVITVADTFEPGSDFRVTISEESGKPMTYTLAVVDEGLLGLTRYRIPDPWNVFYAREASVLRNWDLYNWVAGAYAGKLSTLLAIGGGDEAEAKGGRKANRFPPIVKFFGPITIGKNEKKLHTFTLPNYVGAVRCMVVGGLGGAFGSAEKSVTVRSDMMVLGTLPRVLSPEEKTEFPVTVFAYDPKIKTVNVSVTVKGPVTLDGPAEKTVKFSTPGDTIVTFPLKVAKRTGLASFTIRAVSDSKKTAVHEIELDVRTLGTPVNKVVSKLIEAGQEWRETLALPGATGTNSVTLEISPLPPIDLGKRLQFLIQYPHGCIEQTTSAVFPQVALDQLVELATEQKAEIDKNIKAGIERLKLFQTSSGGFGYWPGDAAPNDWGTNYAGNFLVEAQKRGYTMLPGMIENWISYQKKRSNEWDGATDPERMDQAYRLYTLALAGAPEMGAMNRLREKGGNPMAVNWRLALTYKLAGQKESALKLVAGKDVNVKPYTELGGTFGSELRDKAMILEALVALDMLPLADTLVKEISQRLSGDEWLSTQETAYALIALEPYATMVNRDNPLTVSYGWNGGRMKALTATGKMIMETIDAGNVTDGTIVVKNDGKVKVYPRVIMRGTPLLDMETSVANGMRLDIEYADEYGTFIDPASVEQGKDIVIEISAKNLMSYDLKNIALTAKIPSGWEILNDRLAETSESGARAYDYMDIRDDRVYLYFDLTDSRRDSYNSVKKFRVRVNNTYAGTFYLPAISAEAMYDATIQAIVPGRWLSK